MTNHVWSVLMGEYYEGGIILGIYENLKAAEDCLKHAVQQSSFKDWKEVSRDEIKIEWHGGCDCIYISREKVEKEFVAHDYLY